MQTSNKVIQNRILTACKREGTITTIDPKLREMFERKKTIDEKVANNTPIITWAEAICDTKDSTLITHQKAFSCQKTEQSKMSFRSISRKMKMTEGAVKSQYRKFLGCRL